MKVINVTPNAWKKIDVIIRNTNSYGMLFGIEGGGCNGFKYKLDNLKENLKNLYKFSYVSLNQHKVYVDPLAEIYVLGTTIDYEHEDYDKGVYESKFVFHPDKRKATSCGCGVSFNSKL